MDKKILLIDDDKDDQELFMIALKRLSGYSIWATADHGRDALHKLSAADNAPDVIFVDLNMPMMTGQEFLKEIKTRPELNTIPIIIHTTTTDHEAIEDARRNGAYKFFSKPTKFDELIRLLGPVLDGSFMEFVVR